MGKWSQLSDRQLVEACKQQDQAEPVGEIFNRYTYLIIGVCMKYLKNKVDSEDAASAIYESLGEKIVRHEIQALKSWLYVVTKNHCLMQLRKKKHETISLDIMESDIVAHPTGDNDDLTMDLALLQDCIDKLNQDQKTCVQLFYLQQCCYQDIVEKTSIALKKVKSYLQNGRRNLKICIENSREVD